MSPSLRGALVGFGGVAEHGHLPAYRRDPRFAIRAVVEPDPGARERARRVLADGVRLYPSLGALLEADSVDFLDVAAPPAHHFEATLRAAAAGLHVLVEKPLALTLSQATRARDAARRAHTALLVVHNWHHAPVFRAAREAIAAGAIGAPSEIEFVTERTEPAGGIDGSWRLDAKLAGGGILVDHGWHQFYLARALLGGRDPTSVTAAIERRRYSGASVEDTAHARIRYEGGATARLRLTWAASRRRTRVAIDGAAGRLRIDDQTMTVLASGEAERPWPVEPDGPDDSYHASWFPRVLDAFAAAIADPEHAAENQREALLCQAVIDAAYRSGQRAGDEIAIRV